jgi:hypothetical protein
MAVDQLFYTQQPTKKDLRWHRVVERGGDTIGERWMGLNPLFWQQ